MRLVNYKNEMKHIYNLTPESHAITKLPSEKTWRASAYINDDWSDAGRIDGFGTTAAEALEDIKRQVPVSIGIQLYDDNLCDWKIPKEILEAVDDGTIYMTIPLKTVYIPGNEYAFKAFIDKHYETKTVELRNIDGKNRWVVTEDGEEYIARPEEAEV